ncbi:MAG: PAS domain S-box protein, partial [Gammaproteobacteria bacterium]|nr:PAS domain S-box protein [Gammaproteobacteria bacterium]
MRVKMPLRPRFLPYPPLFPKLLPFHHPAKLLTSKAEKPSSSKPDLTVQDALMDGMVEAVVVTDADGHIERYNKTAETMFGYSQTEALGKNIAMLMPPHDANNHANYVSRYMKTGKAQIIGIGRELEAQRKDGSRFPIHLSIGEFNYKGVIRFVGMM